MKKALVGCVSMGLFLSAGIATKVAAADSDHRFVPSSAPISMRTDQDDETKIGYGYNVIELSLNWNTPFFSQVIREDIGEIDYTVNNLFLGWSKTWDRKNSLEVDLLGGTIKSKAKNNRFTSQVISQGVTADHDGDGEDIGLRLVYGRSLYKIASSDEKRFIDCILAVSLHCAYFSTKNDVYGVSDDGRYMQRYTEEDSGLFLRPAIAIQPVVQVHERVTLKPFIGYEQTTANATYKWHLVEGLDNGVPFSSQLVYQGNSVATAIQLDRETSETVNIGSTFFMGFDVGVKLFESGGELSIGGAISSLSGQNKSSDFKEVHVMYSFPF